VPKVSHKILLIRWQLNALHLPLDGNQRVVQNAAAVLLWSSIASQNRVRNGQFSQQKFSFADYPNTAKCGFVKPGTGCNGYAKLGQEKNTNAG
jgi:hypothetical protein